MGRQARATQNAHGRGQGVGRGRGRGGSHRGVVSPQAWPRSPPRDEPGRGAADLVGPPVGRAHAHPRSGRDGTDPPAAGDPGQDLPDHLHGVPRPRQAAARDQDLAPVGTTRTRPPAGVCTHRGRARPRGAAPRPTRAGDSPAAAGSTPARLSADPPRSTRVRSSLMSRHGAPSLPDRGIAHGCHLVVHPGPTGDPEQVGRHCADVLAVVAAPPGRPPR